ncbi:MAG: hypothetical protein JWL76_1825 [Thermoleophilia bacterium]|nr:hypothetical protein [Thermoleophilia bacterium]
MSAHSDDPRRSLAARRATVISHLDGSLDEHMLDAMQGVWSMLEHAAADAPAHARAVRARLFWESLTPGGAAAAPIAVVSDLTPAWDSDEESTPADLDEASADQPAQVEELASWADADAA